MTKRVILVLDRSGSMAGKEQEVRNGFKEILGQILRDAPESLVTTILFDDRIDILYKNKPATSVPELDYSLGGSTSLFDAIGIACLQISEDETTVVIITDGQENSSRKYSLQNTETIIKHLKRTGKWEFIFLAENLDVAKQGSNIGVQSVDYRGNTKVAYEVGALSVSNRLKGLDMMAGVREYVEANTDGGVVVGGNVKNSNITTGSNNVNQSFIQLGKFNLNAANLSNVHIGEDNTES